MMDTVSCSGVFCDCSQCNQKNVACGCMFEGEHGACVTEYTLTIPLLFQSGSHDSESINEC